MEVLRNLFSSFGFSRHQETKKPENKSKRNTNFVRTSSIPTVKVGNKRKQFLDDYPEKDHFSSTPPRKKQAISSPYSLHNPKAQEIPKPKAKPIFTPKTRSYQLKEPEIDKNQFTPLKSSKMTTKEEKKQEIKTKQTKKNKKNKKKLFFYHLMMKMMKYHLMIIYKKLISNLNLQKY